MVSNLVLESTDFHWNILDIFVQTLLLLTKSNWNKAEVLDEKLKW